MIFEINDHFLEYVKTYVTTDMDFIRRVFTLSKKDINVSAHGMVVRCRFS